MGKKINSKNNALTQQTYSMSDKAEEIAKQAKKAEEIAKQTKKAIDAGNSNPIASNGTPMKKLSGAAETTARLKNIGREVVKDGGMIDGIKTIELNARAEAAVQTFKCVQENLSTQPLIEQTTEKEQSTQPLIEQKENNHI